MMKIGETNHDDNFLPGIASSAKNSRNIEHLRPDMSRFSVPPIARKSGIIVQNPFTQSGSISTRIPKTSSEASTLNKMKNVSF